MTRAARATSTVCRAAWHRAGTPSHWRRSSFGYMMPRTAATGALPSSSVPENAEPTSGAQSMRTASSMIATSASPMLPALWCASRLAAVDRCAGTSQCVACMRLLHWFASVYCHSGRHLSFRVQARYHRRALLPGASVTPASSSDCMPLLTLLCSTMTDVACCRVDGRGGCASSRLGGSGGGERGGLQAHVRRCRPHLRRRRIRKYQHL